MDSKKKRRCSQVLLETLKGPCEMPLRGSLFENPQEAYKYQGLQGSLMITL